MLRKVISGGQTGVDRAGLDAAIAAGFPIGGYCPQGRLAEDGNIPLKYPMVEMDSPESYYRTEKNVMDSDGTLILNKGELTEGTRLTYDFTVKYGKPALEWVMERYQFTRDKDSGITNDPNDWSTEPRYIIDLVKRIVRVSMETMKIVNALPALNEHK